MTLRLAALAVLSLAGCAGAAESSAGALASPQAIADHECASCGMIVREQPAPRAQVVHRDGTHEWFCSIADLVAYRGSPSRHGRIEHTWVEILPPDVDPAVHDMGEARWVEVERAAFVLGVERNMIMGAPVLSFATEADARAAAERLGGRTTRWDETERELGGAQ